ncbi:MAG: twin-arginine translocase TatA/TatE family subunit [Deltaproteobacteria bacterium]|nr:twin-arginine translocase TatA/TatE family subunit [Deltaproteobacteria bacterium]
MFNMGFGEMLVVAIVALIFIQPQNLPKVATSIGRFLGDLKRGFDEVKNNVNKSLKDGDK